MTTEFPTDWKLLPIEACMAAIIDYQGKSPRKVPFGVPFLMVGFVYGVLGYALGVLSFPQPHPANFEGALAGGLAGILAGACVGLEGRALKGVTAGLVGGSVAQILGSVVAPLSILALGRIYGTVFGGLGAVAGQLDPGLLGAFFGGVLGGFFLTSFSARLGEIWGEICVGIVSGILAFTLILTTEVTLMSLLKITLRAVTFPSGSLVLPSHFCDGKRFLSTEASCSARRPVLATDSSCL